jgi:acetyl-CoA/propionyl-CoA carboxylase biotin carboxyl carrier protein
MFGSVLVANRGEIAVRVFRTLRRLGIVAVAVYADADAGARHVREADRAVGLRGGYLDVDSVVAAALAVGADAVHPGYGFLSENPRLARAVVAAGLAWVGPPADAIETMGDKIRAKATVGGWDVPTVPGGGAPGMSDAALAAVARSVGFPVLVKPSAGGGGKGMRVVGSPDELGAAMASARREAAAAFGDDTLLIERWIQGPRHIEIQVLADGHGHVVHLGERECSLQRRHQKVVEEAPSPLVAGRPETRRRMGEAAVNAARAVGYTNAGTVEFVVPGERPDDFFFMEMNTRLQVEHPVTEMVTGVDLVEWQLRVAAGEPLGFSQDDICWRGHAVEARVYAEDPARGFLPTGGRVVAWRPPAGDGVRVDAGIDSGDVVTSDFDPMLAKVVAWAPDRAGALQRLEAALGDTVLFGLGSNVGFLRRLAGHPAVVAGALDTGLIERQLESLIGGGGEGGGRETATAVVAAEAAAVLRWCQAWAVADPADPWSTPSGWRMGGPAWQKWRLRPDRGEAVEVRVRPAPGTGPGRPGEVEVQVAPVAGGTAGDGDDGTGGDTPTSVIRRPTIDGDGFTLWRGEARYRWTWAEDGGRLWLGADGEAWTFEELPLAATGPSGAGGGGAGEVRSPMPGVVRVVRVNQGDAVTAGQELVAVEAMKMEYSVTAGVGGTVKAVRVHEGQRVALDEVLAEIDLPAGA